MPAIRSNYLYALTRNKKQLLIKLLKRILAFSLVLHIAFLLTFAILIVCLITNNPLYSMLSVYRGAFCNATISPKIFTPLTAIPPHIVTLFIQVEDSRFNSHHGVDLRAIKYAYELNRKYNAKLYGASTITQQLARTLFLWPGKSYLRKYLEALIALELDMILSKSRILELYLNEIEFGPGIFGISAGSLHHFGKPLTDLNNEEIAKLVTIIANPIKYTPDNLAENGLMSARHENVKDKYGLLRNIDEEIQSTFRKVSPNDTHSIESPF